MTKSKRLEGWIPQVEKTCGRMRNAIKNLSIYFNGRLIVNTIPEAKEQIMVSKANAPKFKAWLNLG